MSVKSNDPDVNECLEYIIIPVSLYTRVMFTE